MRKAMKIHYKTVSATLSKKTYSLQSLVDKYYIKSLIIIKKFINTDDVIIFCRQLTAEYDCVDFTLRRNLPVARLSPYIQMKVYDWFSPGKQILLLTLSRFHHVFRAHFSYEHLFSIYVLLHSYKKCARKTLVKSTPCVNFITILRANFSSESA